MVLFQFDQIMPTTSEKDIYGRTKRTKTVVFCLFIFLQISNIVMSRKLDGQINMLEGLHRNKVFVMITFIIIGVQMLAITIGSAFTGTTTMNWQECLFILIVCLISFPVTMFGKWCFKTARQRAKRVNPMDAAKKRAMTFYSQGELNLDETD